jgi:hypothetical protein
MIRETNQASGKKIYEPPQLAAISLRPEEAVLGHCKISGQSQPGNICGVVGLCPTAGS